MQDDDKDDDEDDDDDTDQDEEPRSRSRSQSRGRNSRSRSRGANGGRRHSNQIDWSSWQCEVRNENEQTRTNDKKNDVAFDQTIVNVQMSSLKQKFLLDTGSTISATVMNADLVTNIRMSKKPTIMSLSLIHI